MLWCSRECFLSNSLHKLIMHSLLREVTYPTYETISVEIL